MRRSDDWFTQDEVDRALHRSRCRNRSTPTLSDPLLEAVYSGEVFSIRLLQLFPRATPSDDGVEFYHAVPEDPMSPGLGITQFATIYDMPLEIKRKLVEKIESMYARGEVSRPARPEMYALTMVDQRLNALRLLEPRRRPEHGLQYMCRWQALSFPPPSWSRASRQLVWVNFAGTIKTPQPLIPSASWDRCASPNHYDSQEFSTLWTSCTIRQYREFATLTLDRVACYTVDPMALAPTGSLRAPPDNFWYNDPSVCPTRRSIISRTRRLLLAAADATPAAAPFTPIKCRFKLLKQQPAPDDTA